MRRTPGTTLLIMVFVLSFWLTSFSRGQDAKTSELPKDSRLAIAGDSITEQKMYSKYMEAYLLACAGRTDIAVFQFGWGGERAGGFSARLENDLSGFRPTTVTLCYGMNDGGYRLYSDAIGNEYEKNMRSILEKLKAIGVTHIVAGSPGAVDTKYFQRNNADFGGKSAADGYNENLRHLRDIDEKLASEFKISFADVHTAMIDAMAKAKKEKGDDFDVCGRDGVHPGADGQLVMAYAFLKGLGCEGDIAEITVDMNDAAVASEGHKVISASGGKVELESIKYPFCFDPDPNQSRSNRSILPYIAFNQDLNRFMLKVKNLSAPKAKVTWGSETKEFTKEQLESGINLAAEFVKTPFDGNFTKIMQSIAAKQNFETQMIKGIITNFRSLSGHIKADPELGTVCDTLKKKLIDIQSGMDAGTKALIVPVKHTLSIVPVP